MAAATLPNHGRRRKPNGRRAAAAAERVVSIGKLRYEARPQLEVRERMADRLAVIFGGSGSVGRNVVRELARRGWRVRVAVRRPHLAQFLRPMGHVGQVQLAQTNIRNRDSVARALQGADAAVNLVGVLYQSGAQSFRSVHAQGAATIAELAAAAGVKSLVHVSAIGADRASKSRYARTKAEGEAAVRAAFPQAVIMRPSVIFGPEDQLFNRFAAMLTMAPPFLPVPILIGGGKTRFQPVYVDDVADAISEALARSDAAGKTYELGGPRIYSFKELLALLLGTIGRKRMLAPVPFALAPAMGLFCEAFGALPFIKPPITRDQIKLMQSDNVVGEGALTLADLGIAPRTVEAILPAYMGRFRKYGQFAEVAA
jgi:NADH dehydrogenase